MPPISDQDLERLADRIVERVLIRLGPSERGEFVDASAIARRFSLSRSWVCENAEQLGVVRVGSGPRARLRFDPSIVRERLARLAADEPHSGGRAAAVGLPRSKATCCPFEAAAQS